MVATPPASETPARLPRQRIGPVIRQLRLQHGLSLLELAERTDVSVSYLSRLEKGLSVPAFTILSRLAAVLDTNIGFFVGMEHEAQTVDEQLAAALTHTTLPAAVWPELFTLSLDARKALLAFLAGQDVAGTGTGSGSGSATS